MVKDTLKYNTSVYIYLPKVSSSCSGSITGAVSDSDADCLAADVSSDTEAASSSHSREIGIVDANFTIKYKFVISIINSYIAQLWKKNHFKNT